MQSNMETSTSWPSPVRSRWRRAIITLRVTNSAVTPSQMDSATLAGDSGCPSSPSPRFGLDQPVEGLHVAVGAVLPVARGHGYR